MNCPDALWNVIHAYKGLRIINRRLAAEAELKLVFDRYQLCKHVLTLLGILLLKYGTEPYKKHIKVLSINALLSIISEIGKKPLTNVSKIIEKIVRELLEES
ncbi:MAG: hypothetical protein J7J82_03540 [Staphylothermus sp.]|nr:hypothetical protein [Staphylothermus sp.]